MMTADAIWTMMSAVVGGLVALGGLSKWLLDQGGRMRELQREDKALGDSVTETKASIQTLSARIDGLEHARVADVERIVRLESAMHSMDKTLERIETGQSKIVDVFTSRFDQYAESLREIRTVTVRT